MTKDELKIYFRHLAYDLENGMLDGLKCYYDILWEEGLLKEVPPLEFVEGAFENQENSLVKVHH
jgi:hypothetical protein